MRILVVSQYFWPEEFIINDICIQLKNQGHEIEVLTGIPNYPSGDFFKGYGLFHKLKDNYEGVKIHRTWLFPRRKGGGVSLVLNYLSFAFFASLKVLSIKYSKFDAVFIYEVSPITQAFPALLIRALHKTPVCLYVLDLWPESIQAAGNINNSLIMKWTEKMVNFIYQRCDHIMISSRSFKENIIEHGYPEERITYLPNWVEDATLNKKSGASQEEAINIKEKFVIMCAGNIGHAQGIEVLLKAAERLKEATNIHFAVLGDGRMREWAEKEVLRLGLSNVTFFGRKPRETMPNYFAQADALIVTLRKEKIFALTMPARVQAYMASGRPIVACVDGETAATVEEAGAGLTCPAEDDEALAGLVLQMSNMSQLEREKMGQNGLEYANKEFSKELLIQKLNNVLCKLNNNYINGVFQRRKRDV